MAFMAEIEKAKQEYLSARFPGVPIFNDVGDMTKNYAPTSDSSAARVPQAGYVSVQCCVFSFVFFDLF